MAVTFTGLSGLQMSSYTSSLFVGSQTWAISMFLRAPLDIGTNDAINNTRIIFGLDQDLTPYTYTTPSNQQAVSYASDKDVFSVYLMSSNDTTKVMMGIGVYNGQTFCNSVVTITRGVPNHLVFGPDPVNRIIQIYINGTPIQSGNNQSYAGEPWPEGSMTNLRFGNNSPYAIRLGNLDLISTYPDVYTSQNSPGSMGGTTFSIEQVCAWDGYFPTSSEVLNLKGRNVTPDQVGPSGSLKIWWSLADRTGIPTSGDDSLVNRVNPGTFNLLPV